MRNRLKASNRDLREVMTYLDPTNTAFVPFTNWDVKRATKFAANLGAALPAYTDKLVSLATWSAAYNKAMDGKAEDITSGDHKAAVSYADHAVRFSLGSGLNKDLAQAQRGSEFQKLHTALMGWYIQNLNQFSTEVNLAKRGQISYGHLFLQFLLVVYLPAMISRMLAGDSPDDDESWIWWGLETPFQSLISGIPFARDLYSSSRSAFVGEGWVPDTAVANFYKVIERAGRQVYQKELDMGLFYAMVDGVGAATGAPSGQIKRTVRAVEAEGKGKDLEFWHYLLGAPRD